MLDDLAFTFGLDVEGRNQSAPHLFQRVAAGTNQVCQQWARQSQPLLFLLENDLPEGQVRQILTGLVIDDQHIFIRLNQGGDMLKSHIPLCFRIIELAVQYTRLITGIVFSLGSKPIRII